MPINKITPEGPQLSDADITAVENALGVRLPAAYRSFLMAYNGGRPEPSSFGRDRIPSLLSYFCSIQAYEAYYDLLEQRRNLQERMPAEVIPIAEDQCGNFICLAVKGKNRGKVYFWDHEGGVERDDIVARYPEIDFGPPDPDEPDAPVQDDWPGHPDLTLIADSFDEFLDSFHDDDEAPVPESESEPEGPT